MPINRDGSQTESPKGASTHVCEDNDVDLMLLPRSPNGLSESLYTLQSQNGAQEFNQIHKQISPSCKNRAHDGFICESRHNGTCAFLSKTEFYNFTLTMPVVELYRKNWKVGLAYLERICGVNMRRLYCDNAQLPVASVVEQPKDCTIYISQSLIPEGMPYMTVISKVYGIVYSTPFYSVVPRLISKVPATTFSFHKLTLDKVVNNILFRHELAFNHDLKIVPPLSLLKKSLSDRIWRELEYEIRDFSYSTITRPPIPILFQVIEGIKSLLLSVLPVSLCSKVIFRLDLFRCIDVDASIREQSLVALTRTIGQMLDFCVLPNRKSGVKKVNKYFSNGFDDPSQMVAGLRSTIVLLNLSKIDLINARVKERLPLLWQTSCKNEASFYQSQVKAGKIDPASFIIWLRHQPELETFIKYSNLNGSVSYESFSSGQSEWFLSRLAGGFLNDYLRTSSRIPVSSIFQLDMARIAKLQRCFDKFVIQQLKNELTKPNIAKFHGVNRLLQSSTVHETKVYKVIESRLMETIAQKIYHQFVLNKKNDFQLTVTNSGDHSSLEDISLALDKIISEITMLLSLHWAGAREFYQCMA